VLRNELNAEPYLRNFLFNLVKNNCLNILKRIDNAKNGKIVVLTIHGVPDAEHPWVNTPPELFKEYLKYLHDHHFKVKSLRDLIQYVNVRIALNQIPLDHDKPISN